MILQAVILCVEQRIALRGHRDHGKPAPDGGDDNVKKVSQGNSYCVKSVQIRSFFWSIFSYIRTEYGPEKTMYLDTFHAVFLAVVNAFAKFDTILKHLRARIS